MYRGTEYGLAPFPVITESLRNYNAHPSSEELKGLLFCSNQYRLLWITYKAAVVTESQFSKLSLKFEPYFSFKHWSSTINLFDHLNPLSFNFMWLWCCDRDKEGNPN